MFTAAHSTTITWDFKFSHKHFLVATFQLLALSFVWDPVSESPLFEQKTRVRVPLFSMGLEMPLFWTSIRKAFLRKASGEPSYRAFDWFKKSKNASPMSLYRFPSLTPFLSKSSVSGNFHWPSGTRTPLSKTRLDAHPLGTWSLPSCRHRMLDTSSRTSFCP